MILAQTVDSKLLNNNQIWFRSTLFEIEPHEDAETKPYCFGRQLANWIQMELIIQGHPVEEVMPNDGAWCLIIHRKPFLLWLRCENDPDQKKPAQPDTPPLGSEVIWTCTVVAEKPFLGRLFNRTDIAADMDLLFNRVSKLIKSNARNTIINKQLPE